MVRSAVSNHHRDHDRPAAVGLHGGQLNLRSPSRLNPPGGPDGPALTAPSVLERSRVCFDAPVDETILFSAPQSPPAAAPNTRLTPNASSGTSIGCRSSATDRPS